MVHHMLNMARFQLVQTMDGLWRFVHHKYRFATPGSPTAELAEQNAHRYASWGDIKGRRILHHYYNSHFSLTLKPGTVLAKRVNLSPMIDLLQRLGDPDIGFLYQWRGESARHGDHGIGCRFCDSDEGKPHNSHCSYAQAVAHVENATGRDLASFNPEPPELDPDDTI